MRTFVCSIETGDLDGHRFEELDALVDTGATYTSVPRDMLARLGIEPEEEASFILANGQSVNLGMAWIRIRLDYREQPTLVIFGDPGSTVLLGAFTLEGFRLGMDAVNKRLIPTPGYLVGMQALGPRGDAFEREEGLMTQNARDFARFPGVRVEMY